MIAFVGLVAGDVAFIYDICLLCLMSVPIYVSVGSCVVSCLFFILALLSYARVSKETYYMAKETYFTVKEP